MPDTAELRFEAKDGRGEITGSYDSDLDILYMTVLRNIDKVVYEEAYKAIIALSPNLEQTKGMIVDINEWKNPATAVFPWDHLQLAKKYDFPNHVEVVSKKGDQIFVGAMIETLSAFVTILDKSNTIEEAEEKIAKK